MSARMDEGPVPRDGSGSRLLISGILALMVAMGIGRFAYTPILPSMKSGAGLGDAFAGILASANYAGYLAGALWATRPVFGTNRTRAIRYGLVAGSFATIAMGFTTSPVLWFALRFAGGVATAIVFVSVSSIVLDRAARDGLATWPGLLYSGVGIGIALTGIAVPLLANGGWRESWIALGTLSLVVSIAVAGGFQNVAHARAAPVAGNEQLDPRAFRTLLLAYFGVGIGYIIPATFIVAILRATPQLAGFAASSWVIVGVVAAPSAFFWTWVAARFGRITTIVVAIGILALGVVAPVYVRNAAGAGFSAFSLGLTFTGITSLVNTEGRALFPHSSNRAIGQLTAVFGVGQIVGPLVVSAVAAAGARYDSALVAGALVLAASAATLLAGRGFTQVAARRAGVRETSG